MRFVRLSALLALIASAAACTSENQPTDPAALTAGEEWRQTTNRVSGRRATAVGFASADGSIPSFGSR